MRMSKSETNMGKLEKDSRSEFPHFWISSIWDGFEVGVSDFGFNEIASFTLG